MVNSRIIQGPDVISLPHQFQPQIRRTQTHKLKCAVHGLCVKYTDESGGVPRKAWEIHAKKVITGLSFLLTLLKLEQLATGFVSVFQHRFMPGVFLHSFLKRHVDERLP